MTLNIAIIENKIEDADKLEALLSEYAEDNQIHFVILRFSNADDFLTNHTGSKPDLIFLDIDIPGNSGFNVAELLSRQSRKPLLVFFTESHEYMLNALHLHVYDYLIKPVDSEMVYRLMNDVLSLNPISPLLKELSFSSGKVEYNMPYDMIVAVKSEGHYLDICTINGESYKTRMTYSNITSILSADPRFLIVLRGIIVNMDYILEMKKGSCLFKNGLKLPVNIKNCKHLEQTWQAYMFNKKIHP